MRRFALLVFLTSPLAITTRAQVLPQITGAGAPTNPCYNGGQQYFDTTNRIFYNCSVPGQNWVNIGVGNNTGGNAQNSLGTAGNLPQAASYNVYLNSGTVYARNNLTGNIDYSGTDAGTVINSVLTNSTTCGELHFKTGDYSFNSMTLETTGGYSNYYYAVGIPANSGTANQYCQWKFIGDAANMTGSGANALTTGVIFDVTAAARTSCGTGHTCVAWWHRPDTTNHLGNDIRFENITTRFPDNQRGSEAAYLMWEAATVDYYNVIATLNTSIGAGGTPTISPAVSTGTHMIAFSSTMPSRNNWNEFKNTWAIGYDYCYDVESEHTMAYAASAWACNYAIQYARTNSYGSFTSSLSYHPSLFEKFTDQETINGLVIGSNAAAGSRLDLIDYDIETGAGSFARSTNMTETNVGYSSGLITYEVVVGGSRVVSETPPNTLFSSGGSNFQLFESTTNPNIAKSAISDTFTHPNQSPISGTTLGSAWVLIAGTPDFCGITSNTAVTGGTAATGACLDYYAGQAVQPDQFSKFTVSNASSSGQTDAIVRASTSNVQTYYEYDCSTSGGQITKRRIGKEVAGTFTQLATTSANSGCANGDTMELWAVGSTIIGFYTPSGGTRTLDLIASDSAITSGQPGVFLFNNATATSPAITNFVGGSLPAASLGSSIFGQIEIAPQYATLSRCAANGTSAATSLVACGSAASGLFSVPITTPTAATVSTTAVTANSVVIVEQRLDTAAGTALGVTCNTTTNATFPNVNALTAATSFTIPNTAFTTNPGCYQYWIIN